MDYTIKELPEDERPRERLFSHGAETLSDSELVAIVLGSGTSGKNAKELASEIVSCFPVSSFANRSASDFQEFEGVSTAKASRLIAVGELARRTERQEREKISSLQDIRSEASDMKLLEKEKLRVFYLSSGNEVLDRDEFDGSVSSVGLPLREILGNALARNASAIVIVHNHPSGSSEPTKADLDATRDLVDAGQTLGVSVLDHVVVGRKFHSMRANSEGGF